MENTQDQQSTLERPRFRSDLVAQPLEEEGVRYVDVTDPSSGNTFRFYDVEYSIACAMDGARDLDNLAEWTRVELGIEASTEELTSVINTLAELGYLEGVNGPGVPEAVDGGDTEAALPPGEGANGSAWTDETARQVSAAYDDALATKDHVPEAPAVIDEGAVPEPVAHPNVAAAEHAREISIEVEPVEPALEPPRLAKKAPEAETSFAGLLDDSPPTPPPPPEPAELPRGLAPSSKTSGKATDGHLDDEDPTQVPTAHVDEDEEDDDVSVDLSAHLALDKHEVQEAIRESRVHVVPPIPPAEAAAEASSPVAELSALGGTPLSGERLATQPQTEEPRVAPATPLPARPPIAQPPRVRASRPIEPTKMPPPARAPQKKGSAVGAVAIVLAIALLLVGLMYAFRERIFGSDEYTSRVTPAASPDKGDKPAEPATPTATAPTPTAEPAKAPETAPAKAPPPPPAEGPTATVRSETAPTGAGDKVTVSAPAGGQVVWMAEKGASVEAGAPVAKLLGYAKWEAKLKDANDRGGFYAKKLAEAQAKGDQAAIDAAQGKVNEKKEILDEAQKALEKLTINAPSAGKVKPLVAVGADIKDGAQVAEVAPDADKPQTTLRASFDVGDGASQYAEGKPAIVASKGAPDKQFAAVVEKIDGGKVDVKVVPAGGSVPAAGDEITLLPPKK